MDPSRRLLIIGAHGFIGEHLAVHAAERWNVFGGCLRATSDSEVSIDITDAASVAAAFERVHPQVVVHLAALADIDRCEAEPALAEAVNVRGAENVARECARTGARLIFTSTGAVFAGTRHGYRETDAPTPVGVYGRTKAAAEQTVAGFFAGAAIVRLALVVGRGMRPGTNAMLDKLETNFAAGKVVVAPSYEVRNPIDVTTLCRVFVDLAARPDAQGIFHAGATDSISRFDLVANYAERMGYSRALVSPLTELMPGRAPRGLDQFLLCDRLRSYISQPLPSLDEVIERSLYVLT